MPRKKEVEATEVGEVGELAPDEIGLLCASVVAKYTKPNVNARTMLSMPEFWGDITRALRGESVEGLPEPPVEPEPAADPVLDSIEPESLELGSPDTTVFFRGTGFTAASVIVWNGGDEPTGFVSDTELTTVVKPSTASGAVDIPVSVRNGEVYTDPLTFSFTEAETIPAEFEIDDEDAPKRGRRRKP
jgi:IPT/TIG domain